MVQGWIVISASESLGISEGKKSKKPQEKYGGNFHFDKSLFILREKNYPLEK